VYLTVYPSQGTGISMTPLEHYEAAEELLASPFDHDTPPEVQSLTLMAAQVHATLATVSINDLAAGIQMRAQS